MQNTIVKNKILTMKTIEVLRVLQLAKWYDGDKF